MTINQERIWCDIVFSPDDDGWYGVFVDGDTFDYTDVESGIMDSEIEVILWAKEHGATDFMGSGYHG